MRKRYYFRRSDRGLLAWDVDRLVELSADLPTQRVPVTEIAELGETHWVSGDNTPTCRAIAAAGSRGCSIGVFREGKMEIPAEIEKA